MAIVKIEGKSITVPDEIVQAGKDAIRAALAVEFEGVENAQIEIVAPDSQGGPSVVTVSKRASPKGYGARDFIAEQLIAAPAYVNPAIALAAEVMRAELDGNPDVLERSIRSGAVERAIAEGSREGKDVLRAMQALGHIVPRPSVEVPPGFGC